VQGPLNIPLDTVHWTEHWNPYNPCLIWSTSCWQWAYFTMSNDQWSAVSSVWTITGTGFDKFWYDQNLVWSGSDV